MKSKISILAIPLIGILIFLGVQTGSRVGENKISIQVIPNDATISVNGKNIGSGSKTIYLKSGNYTFTASKEGWKTEIKNIKVTGDTKLHLIPTPVSQEAVDWLSENLDVQLEREKFGGEDAAKNSANLEKRYPVIKELPYNDLIGPFSIDYGPDHTNGGSVKLIVSDSTAPGRYEAQKWIEGQGQKLSEINIIYFDFVNPLVTGVDQ